MLEPRLQNYFFSMGLEYFQFQFSFQKNIYAQASMQTFN